VIGGDIRIVVVGIGSGQVKIGIDTPKGIPVLRSELSK
jgi:carbon storage regulator CsrA